MNRTKKEVVLFPKNELKATEPKKLRKLNDIEDIDAFEILDVEEKLDFKPPVGGGCVNINVWCS